MAYSAPDIKSLSAFDINKIQQSLSEYQKTQGSFNATGQGYSDRVGRTNFERIKAQSAAARKPFQSGKNYGIEDEYRYMVSQGFRPESMQIAPPQTQPTAQAQSTPEPAPKTVTSNIPAYQPKTSSGSGIFDKYALVWPQDNKLGFGRESYEAAIAAGLTHTQLAEGLVGQRVGKYATQKITEGVAAEKQKSQPSKTPTTTSTPSDDGSAAVISQLRTDISDLTTNFANQMKEMQSSFAQSMASRNTRGRVQGIRTANRGTGGATQQQLQRRGVKGTFGRGGDRLLKISSLNV